MTRDIVDDHEAFQTEMRLLYPIAAVAWFVLPGTAVLAVFDHPVRWVTPVLLYAVAIDMVVFAWRERFPVTMDDVAEHQRRSAQWLYTMVAGVCFMPIGTLMFIEVDHAVRWLGLTACYGIAFGILLFAWWPSKRGIE